MFGNLSLLVTYHDGFLKVCSFFSLTFFDEYIFSKHLMSRVTSWNDDSIISDLFLNECHFLPCYEGMMLFLK